MTDCQIIYDVTVKMRKQNSEERVPIQPSTTENNYNAIDYNGTAPLSRHSSGSESGYTELLSGSVPCPTCRGLGNVPKGDNGIFQNQNSLLVKRQTDNTTPGGMGLDRR